MTGNWRLDVDRRRCIGSGVCRSTAPEHFSVDGTRRARPVAAEVAADERLLDAAAICPMEAISIVDSISGRTLFPQEEGHH